MRKFILLFLLLILFASSVHAQQNQIQQKDVINNVKFFFGYKTLNGALEQNYLPVVSEANNTATFYVGTDKYAYADVGGTQRVYPSVVSGSNKVIQTDNWGIAVTFDKQKLQSILPTITANATLSGSKFSKEALLDPKNYSVKVIVPNVTYANARGDYFDCEFDSSYVSFVDSSSVITTYVTPVDAKASCYEAFFNQTNFPQHEIQMELKLTEKDSGGATIHEAFFCRRDSNRWNPLEWGRCDGINQSVGDATDTIYPDFSFEENKLNFAAARGKTSQVNNATCSINVTEDKKNLILSTLQSEGYPIRMVFDGKQVYKTQDFYESIMRQGRPQNDEPKIFYIKQSGDRYFIATNQNNDSFIPVVESSVSDKLKYLFNDGNKVEIVQGDIFTIINLNLAPGEKKFSINYEPNVDLGSGQLGIDDGGEICHGVIYIDNNGNVSAVTEQTSPITPTPPLTISQNTSSLLCQTLRCDNIQEADKKQICIDNKEKCEKCVGANISNELEQKITQLENEIANLPDVPIRAVKMKELQDLKQQLSAIQQTHIWTGVGCISTDFSSMITDILRILGGIMGLFILYCIAWNGFKVMISRGNPEAMKKAQEDITGCVVGFLILMLSVIILRIIGVDLLGLPFLSK